MLVWMVYVIVVSCLLSAAALCAEHALRASRGSTRWIWLIGIVASLVVPVVISTVSIQIPSIVSPTAVQKVVPLNSVTSSTLSPLRWMAGHTGSLQSWRGLDTILKGTWLAVSLLLTAGLAACGAHLFWRKRHWLETKLDGVDVFVSHDVGPAVVGLLRPQVVLPEWIVETPPARRAMVIAHERAHLDAGDQRLLTVALCLLVFMPWNLPLWWQLRRLRRAIEIDCDARVLRHGHSTADYGKTLLAVGERRSAFVGAVAAMSESVSFLEQRIRIMTLTPARWRRLTTAALGFLSLVIFTVAAQVSPPNASPSGNPQEITLAAAVLDRYVGEYQLSPTVVMSVTRKDQQLSTQLTGQPAVEIYPQSETSFFLKVVKASIDFVSDAQGLVTGLVLHQNGADISAQRIDAATAQQIKTDLAARVQTQTPAPGSEAALRTLIAGVMSGNPDYAALSPVLADAVRKQLPTMQPWLQGLGPVQSLEFRGVGAQGADVYAAHHEKGITVWRIAVGADGKVAGAVVQPGP